MECDRPEVAFLGVWVQFASGHKSADKCGGNCGNSGGIELRTYACNVQCSTWHLYSHHIQTTTPHQTTNRWCDQVDNKVRAEFLQTLQMCRICNTTNCRTRKWRLQIYGGQL